MTAPRGIPPGRAGRTWLHARLTTARRAADLLRAKLHVLQGEQQRYHREAGRTAAAWAASCRAAEEWSLRAALLGGRRALLAAVPSEPARVEVVRTLSMGVEHPVTATVRGGEPAATAVPPGNAALVQAAAASRAALASAAEHAAVTEAVRRLDAEVTATRRRLRAVEDRWIPRLTEALHELEAVLAETELAEGDRLRRAHGGFRTT